MFLTEKLFRRINERCPELMDVYLHSNLFKLPETEQMNDDESNPMGMARRYQIPYLGKLPMDPNMMRSCEEGRCFLESYPSSTATKAFGDIIKTIVAATPDH